MLPAPQRRAMHACVLLVCAQAAQALAPHKLHATTPARMGATMEDGFRGVTGVLRPPPQTSRERDGTQEKRCVRHHPAAGEVRDSRQHF